MPLRQQYAEIAARLGNKFGEERRARDAFFGLGSLFYNESDSAKAEKSRLQRELAHLKDRIYAIAGSIRWERPQYGDWRAIPHPASYDDLKLRTPLDKPIDTPHSWNIIKCQREVGRVLSQKPSLEEDAACRLHEEEQLRRAERKSQREAAAVEREAAKKRKAEAERAAVASATGKAREHADNVRRSLRKDHDCPYCGCELGKQPHADHIYPLSKGGRSVAVNMVYVCAICNNKKADMTLAAFVATYRLARDTIESRLQRLGKEY
jgi:5-methylcytosine-specific restriction endonuclease McrA